MPNDIIHDPIVVSAAGATYPALITGDRVAFRIIEWADAIPGATCEFRVGVDSNRQTTSTGEIIFKRTMVAEPQIMALGEKHQHVNGIFCNTLTSGVVYFRSGS